MSPTCPEAQLVEVGAAAVVGLAQVVAATVWGIQLRQLKAPVPAGAGGGHVRGRRAGWGPHERTNTHTPSSTLNNNSQMFAFFVLNVKKYE